MYMKKTLAIVASVAMAASLSAVAASPAMAASKTPKMSYSGPTSVELGTSATWTVKNSNKAVKFDKETTVRAEVYDGKKWVLVTSAKFSNNTAKVVFPANLAKTPGVYKLHFIIPPRKSTIGISSPTYNVTVTKAKVKGYSANPIGVNKVRFNYSDAVRGKLGRTFLRLQYKDGAKWRDGGSATVDRNVKGSADVTFPTKFGTRTWRVVIGGSDKVADFTSGGILPKKTILHGVTVDFKHPTVKSSQGVHVTLQSGLTSLVRFELLKNGKWVRFAADQTFNGTRHFKGVLDGMPKGKTSVRLTVLPDAFTASHSRTFVIPVG